MGRTDVVWQRPVSSVTSSFASFYSLNIRALIFEKQGEGRSNNTCVRRRKSVCARRIELDGSVKARTALKRSGKQDLSRANKLTAVFKHVNLPHFISTREDEFYIFLSFSALKNVYSINAHIFYTACCCFLHSLIR